MIILFFFLFGDKLDIIRDPMFCCCFPYVCMFFVVVVVVTLFLNDASQE